MTNTGKILGAIGIRPPHLMTSLEDYEKLRHVPTWDEIVIDMGTRPEKKRKILALPS